MVCKISRQQSLKIAAVAHRIPGGSGANVVKATAMLSGGQWDVALVGMTGKDNTSRYARMETGRGGGGFCKRLLLASWLLSCLLT